jgi:hypothetical protein
MTTQATVAERLQQVCHTRSGGVVTPKPMWEDILDRCRGFVHRRPIWVRNKDLCCAMDRPRPAPTEAPLCPPGPEPGRLSCGVPPYFGETAGGAGVSTFLCMFARLKTAYTSQKVRPMIKLFARLYAVLAKMGVPRIALQARGRRHDRWQPPQGGARFWASACAYRPALGCCAQPDHGVLPCPIQSLA